MYSDWRICPSDPIDFRIVSTRKIMVHRQDPLTLATVGLDRDSSSKLSCPAPQSHYPAFLTNRTPPVKPLDR